MFKAFKVWLYRRRVKVAIKVLGDLNNIMRLAGYKRCDRRRIWKDLLKNSKVVEELSSVYKMGPSRGG